MAEREQWGSKIGFILAAVGSAIGLGNIWRFSYLAYSNGGGAFLIPYFVALLFVGVAVLLLELALGHSTKGSAPLAFKRLHEKSEWIGWLGVTSGFIITTYYMAIISWGAYYLYKLLLNGFPTTNFSDFFFGSVLQLSSGPGDIGGFANGILISVLFIWLINYVIVNSGVKKGLEKANQIFMTLLFILTIILVIRGITLPGGLEGINWYLTPDFSALTNPRIWLDAFSQIFFTLSLGFGIMIAYSSYLPKKTDLTTSAFTISLLNCGYSFLAGFAVFGTLGYMAYTSGLPFNEVVAQSIGLAFVTFPEALSLMPVGSLILGAIFFLSLVIVGLSSSVSLVEAITSAVMDKFEISRGKAVASVTILGFLGSLLYTTKSGLYWLDIVDHFTASYLLPIVGVFEAVVAIWIFKGEKLEAYLNKLSDIKIGNYWKFFAGILTPVVLLSVIGLDVVSMMSNPYGGYAWSYLGVGIGIAILGVIVSFALSRIPWKKKVEPWDEFVKKQEDDAE